MSDTFQRLRAALGERYVLEREIGAGGMATVYLAQDVRHRRRVALKVVRPELGGPLGLERFLREIELAARLQHPHILPVFDSGLVESGDGSMPYFVMPFVEGESLRDRLQREGRLSPEEAMTLAGEVADALAYAHSQGVVHRDIKPENILLSGAHAVVADFGVAKAIESGVAAEAPAGGASKLTAVGFAIGTPHYMSPEQATGRDVVDARADQYSLGCVLYEMLAGAPPFTGDTAQSIIAKAMTAPRPRPSRAGAGVPPALDAVVLRAMAADPAERYPDMTAFAGALRQARGQAVSRAPGRRGWTAGAAVAVAAAVGVGWMVSRAPDSSVAAAAETIAVLPFSASGPGVEFLGEGMVDLLATNFAGVGGIRTVDPRSVIRRWGERSGGDTDRLRQALEVGSDLGAGSVVMGSVVSAGGRVRLAADLYSTGGDQLGRAQVDGPADSVLQLVDRLSVTLLRDVWRSREPLPNLDLASLTTDSLAALRAFLEGEQLYRRLAFDSALAAYTRATEVDSTFALAQLRRALVYGWTGGYASDSSRAAGAAGVRFAERLSPQHRRLLQSYRLFERGKPASVDSARAFVAQYPDDLEGWFLLGEALYHTRGHTGAPPDSVMMPFDSVLRRDSALVPAAIHPIELALRYRDRARFDRYFSLYERTAPPAQVAAGRAAAAFVWGPEPSDSAFGNAMATNAPLVFYAIHSIYSREEATSDSVVRRFSRLQPRGAQGREFAAEVLGGRADLLAGLGRLEEAGVLADSLEAIAPDEAGRRFRWPIILGMPVDPRYSARLDSLARSQSDEEMTEYVQAVIGLSRGEVAAVRRRLTDRLRVSDTSATGAVVRGQLTAVLGWADLLAGDSAAGLRRLEEGLDAVAAPRSRGPTTFLRFQQALALSSGDATRGEGIQRLRYAFDTEPLFLPLSYFALGRAYEAAGASDSAASAYGQFLRLWDKADAGFQDRIAEAREALERLTAEPRQ